MSVLKRRHEPTDGDTIIHGIVNNNLYKKYQYDLTIDKFNEIGDELEAAGYVKWNTDGQLALTAAGLEHITRFKKD